MKLKIFSLLLDNGCCFPTCYQIILQVVKHQHLLSNMSEHTVDIQWDTSDKSTPCLHHGFHN